MAARHIPLFCPSCGFSDFYTAGALPGGPIRWVVDDAGTVCLARGSDDLQVVTPVGEPVFCVACNALVTGTAVARSSVRAE